MSKIQLIPQDSLLVQQVFNDNFMIIFCEIVLK